MYSRDSNFGKFSGTNSILLEFQVTLGATVAPTINYGANWISSATHTAGQNFITITAKDNIYAVITADATLRDAGVGSYTTLGAISGEASATALSFKVYSWTAAGATANDATGTVGGYLLINNGNITTPGGN